MQFREWLIGQSQQQNQMMPWKARKKEILHHWTNMNQHAPFASLRVIPTDHKGTTYPYDGLRVTGSANFIDTILSRIKDLLSYENQETKLDVIYRQQVNKQTEIPIPQSYVLYLQAKKRA